MFRRRPRGLVEWTTLVGCYALLACSSGSSGLNASPKRHPPAWPMVTGCRTSATELSRPTVSTCTSRRLGRVPSSCSFTASRRAGIPGATSWRRSPKPGTTRLRLTSAATARPTPRRTSRLIRCCTWSATWSACSLPSKETRAVVVGHDWGAPVAWSAALYRPDLVRAVAGLSVPFRPRGHRPPLDVYRELLGDRFYQVYFQEPGVAERDLEADVSRTLRRFLYAASGDAPTMAKMYVGSAGWVDDMPEPEPLPNWLTEADVDYFAGEFRRTGFRGGLNWYRNINRNWELSAPWQGALVTVPAIYVVGDRDPVYHFPGGKELAANLGHFVPQLRQTLILEGAGHWIQQERPAEVNTALLEFFKAL